MISTAEDSLLHFLSDPARRELGRLLAEVPLTVGEIGEVMAMAQPTVSRHLKALRTTGLVVDRRVGTSVISGLVEAPTGDSTELVDLLNGWLREQELSAPVGERLRRVLESRGDDEDRIAQQWDGLRRQYFGGRFHLEALCSLLPAAWHVLDIGTGTGYMLPVLSRNFAQVTAVDPSPAMLELARQRAERDDLRNVTLNPGRLESLPVESESIDAALAILVLHHAEDLHQSVSELCRVLRPGGVVLVVDFEPHALSSFRREMSDPSSGVSSEQLTTILNELDLVAETPGTLPTADTEGVPPRESPPLYRLKAFKKTGFPSKSGKHLPKENTNGN